MNRQWFLAWTAAAGILVNGIPIADAEEPPAPDNTFMRLKVQNSQAVLNGIAVGDFARIEEAADYLVRLSKKTEFQKKDVPDYEHFNQEFRRSAEDLLKTARAKNLDGTTVAYIRLSMSCVACHKHLRDLK